MIIDKENDVYSLPTDEAARQAGCYLDFSLADKFEAFCCNRCKIMSDDYNGRGGRPFILFPYQRTLIRTLYGWQRANGVLRYKECLCFLPRRQGKTLLFSALSTFTALRQQRAEVYLIASTKDEANNAFKRVADFIASDEALSEVFWLRRHIKQIEQLTSDETQGSLIKILSSAKTGKSGFASSLILGDELCSWGNATARDVYARIYDSTKDRPNGLRVFISTPQFDFTTLGRDKWLEAKALLDGEKSDITTLPVIYQAGDDWRNDIEGALRDACPALNLSVPLSEYLDDWNKSKGNALEEVRFETMSLARWVGSPVQWLPSNLVRSLVWRGNESELYGREAVVGIDFARTTDLCVYCLVVEKDGLFYVLPRFFMPRDIGQKKQEQDNVPYLTWARQNHIILTDGDVADPARLREQIKKDKGLFRIKEVRYDPYNFNESRLLLEQDGFACIEVSQSVNTMSGAFIHFEKLAREKRLRIPDNPCFLWCLDNCKPRLNKEKLIVEKASTIQRIDAVDATCIALTHWLEKKYVAPRPAHARYAVVF